MIEAGAMARYTHGHHESVLRSHRWRTAENSAAYLLAHLKTDDRLLDVGCGPGTISIDFARRIPAGEVIGIDEAEMVLVDARSLAVSEQVNNVVFQKADVYDLPFDDNEFDVVHAHQVLQHLGDPIRALVEMRRVCAPGGLIAVRDSDYAAMTWFPLDVRFDRWLALYETLARKSGGEPDAGRRLLSWARAAGLSDIEPSSSTWCFATPELRKWWGELWADRMTKSRLAEIAGESGAASPAELEELAEAWRSWASNPDGWFSLLHGELLCRV
jgi:ubiquinone/menaquinone biosynthesis C-methylase UbiE